ncbi:hypothetical protein D6B98_36565 [Bradyrhizobium sp. LVM 105]|nr:hypothetical protein D6B98_36565 [Bradyrhizobium sp. LVM 105]
MALVLMERHDIYQNQLGSQLDDMQARNNLLKDMRDAMAALRTNRPPDECKVRDYGSFVDWQGKTQDVFDWMQAHGISIEKEKGDKKGVQSQFDAAINNLNGAIDSANSEGEMAMIYFQRLLDDVNRVAELMSNVVSKDEKTKGMIVGNLR